MSVLNPNSDDEPQECPLCMEYLELDDINFYPCSCGYQICRFCWNKIRTEGSGLCPACRSPYAENPADFKPLTAEELAKIKEEKRKKDQAKKQKISENRKHLANVRVVQRNLVFVVGLSPRLADQDVLRKSEYFGKFGRIHKVVINHSTSYAGNQSQGPSASAYVTYFRSEDALRAIQAVNNIFVGGRTLKASLGTTKYCSHFMKNQTCPKHDCMYLHELGDEAASFTKEEMQQGKHTEYEKSLHEELLANTSAEMAESGMHDLVTNGGLGSVGCGSNSSIASASKEAKTSRTPSPKTGTNGSGSGGWPILSSSNNSTPNNSVGGGSKNSSNNLYNFRGDPADSLRDSQPGQITNRDPGSLNQLQHSHLGHGIPTQSGQGSESPASSRSAARTPLDLPDDPPEADLVHHLTDDVLNCDSKQWSLIQNDDLFEEDDLGFDPFHETQKALAEMIESESKQHMEALQILGVGSSLSNGGLSSTSLQHGGNGTMISGRPKQPPPGFSMLNLTGMQPPSVSDLLSQDLGVNGLDNFPTGHHLSQIHQGFGTHNDYANGYRGSNPHHPFGGQVSSPTENHLGQQQLRPHPHQTNKDWQEGLRALLPNINVSFGALPNQADGGPVTNGRLFSSPTSTLNDHPHHHHQQQQHHHNHHERVQRQQQQQQQHSGWNTISPNDWTVLDPAIVGGQLADTTSNGLNHRSESPPNWIKANLEQLTSETFSPGLIPGFMGLNLGGHQPAQQQQQHTGGLNNWGGQSGLLANTPPPGFSFNRGPVVGNNLLQHPYQNLSNNSDGPTHQLENEFRGLIRS